jgi:hypothetical protein
VRPRQQQKNAGGGKRATTAGGRPERIQAKLNDATKSGRTQEILKEVRLHRARPASAARDRAWRLASIVTMRKSWFRRSRRPSNSAMNSS